MVRQAFALFIAVGVLLSFAGCFEGGGFGVTSINDPTEVPENAPAEIGKGDERLTVRVLMGSPKGNGSARTPILVHHIPDPVNAPTPEMLRKVNATFVGRTDENGDIVIKVEKGAYYSIFAYNENFTSEVKHRIRMTTDVLKAPMTIILYHLGMELRIPGTIPVTPVVGLAPLYSKGVPGYYPIFFPRELHFDKDPVSDRAYHYRVQRINFELEADSPTPGIPDVGLRLSFTENYAIDSPNYLYINTGGPTKDPLPLSGAQYRYGITLPKSKPLIGPLLHSTQANPAGVNYVITVKAEFGTDPIEPHRDWRYYNYDLLPGFEAVAVLFAVGGAAFLLRRR